jgi:hypothetical protein
MAQGGEPAKALADMQKAVALSPRNENYQFNLAQMYMTNQNPDQAFAIFRMLSRSSNPEVAQHAAASLAQAQEFKVSLESSRNMVINPTSTVISNSTQQEMSSTVAPVDQSPIKFVKGAIVGVDCSAAPSAVLTVAVGAKAWRMRVKDSKHILVLGADAFSCDWKKQKVALNYRETGDGAGTVVSIEIQ